jgi:hypothetical protein
MEETMAQETNGQTEFAPNADTLRGDIRDMILDELKRLPKPWQQMSESEQRRAIDGAGYVASELVRKTVLLVAHEGFPHLVTSIKKYGVEKGMKVELTTIDSVDNITKLAEHGTREAILVLAQMSKFMGERRPPPKPHPDEPELPIAAE